MGVPAVAALILVLTGPAHSMSLREPTMTVDGSSLTTKGNGLMACAYWLDGSDTTYWLKATKPAGGGTFAISTPTLVSQLPRRYVAMCLNAQGWGPAATGTLDLGLTVP